MIHKRIHKVLVCTILIQFFLSACGGSELMPSAQKEASVQSTQISVTSSALVIDDYSYYVAGSTYTTVNGAFEITFEHNASDSELNKVLELIKTGGKHYDEEDFNAAIDDFTQAINLTPNLSALYFYRAESFSKSGDFRSAYGDYLKAIELDSSIPEYYIFFGDFLVNQEQFLDAISQYDRAISINPNSLLAYSRRASIRQKVGFYKSAYSDFSKLIELEPTNPMYYSNRGLISSILGDHEDAKNNFDKAISINPNFSASLINRGYLYFKIGDYESALKDFEDVTSNDLSYIFAQIDAANTLASIGSYEEALTKFDNVLRHNPYLSEALINRASIYIKLDEYEKALADFSIVEKNDYKALLQYFEIISGKKQTTDKTSTVTPSPSPEEDFEENPHRSLFPTFNPGATPRPQPSLTIPCEVNPTQPHCTLINPTPQTHSRDLPLPPDRELYSTLTPTVSCLVKPDQAYCRTEFDPEAKPTFTPTVSCFEDPHQVYCHTVFDTAAPPPPTPTVSCSINPNQGHCPRYDPDAPPTPTITPCQKDRKSLACQVIFTSLNSQTGDGGAPEPPACVPTENCVKTTAMVCRSVAVGVAVGVSAVISGGAAAASAVGAGAVGQAVFSTGMVMIEETLCEPISEIVCEAAEC